MAGWRPTTNRPHFQRSQSEEQALNPSVGHDDATKIGNEANKQMVAKRVSIDTQESLSAFRMNYVKEQRRQFEKCSEDVSAQSSQKEWAEKIGLCQQISEKPRRSPRAKSKSCLSLDVLDEAEEYNSPENLTAEANHVLKRFINPTPKVAARGAESSFVRDSPSVVKERLGTFENATSRVNGDGTEILAKPEIRPKPVCLATQKPNAGDDNNNKGNVKAIVGHIRRGSGPCLGSYSSSPASSSSSISPDAREVYRYCTPIRNELFGPPSPLSRRSDLERISSPLFTLDVNSSKRLNTPDIFKPSPPAKSLKPTEQGSTLVKGMAVSVNSTTAMPDNSKMAMPVNSKMATPDNSTTATPVNCKIATPDNSKMATMVNSKLATPVNFKTAIYDREVDVNKKSANVGLESDNIKDFTSKSSKSPMTDGSAKVPVSPVPPPKPPRLLNEVQKDFPMQQHLFMEEKTFKKGSGAAYERLADAVSVINSSTSSPYDAQKISTSPPSRNIPIVNDKPTPKSKPVLPADRVAMDQWWESKFIRAPQPVTPRGRENLTKIRQLNNPSYMYAKANQPDDIISGVRPMTRHHSDEMLDSKMTRSATVAVFKPRFNDEPIYHDPNDFITARRSIKKVIDRVKFDKDGYAIPTLKRNAALQNFDASSAPKPKPRASKAAHKVEQERSYVKSKVSNAYAILRLQMLPGDPGRLLHDEDNEIDLEEHRKLLRHVSFVKFKTDESISKYERNKLSSSRCLFQCAMIIGLQEDAVNQSLKPKIIFGFPKEVADREVLTAYFCFPDANIIQPQTKYEGEIFSFILTSENGDRRYGLCKRYLTPGSGPRLPEALCVISSIGEPGFYETLLSEVQSLREVSSEHAEELLQVAYSKPFPLPNHEVYIQTVQGLNFKKRMLILKRMPESRLHTMEFSKLLHHLSVSTLIKVFSAILLERKVIFLAQRLSTLSSCICSLVALLYPFEWQHTFVTILPSFLIDIIDAPIPYILGLLSSSTPDIDIHIDELNEVLVVDLDTGSLRRSCDDEGRIIPRRLQKALTVALADDPDGQQALIPDTEVRGGGGGRGIKDATVAEAFMRMFVETCGHYTEYICSQQNDEIIFQRELFVKAVQSKSIRLFLEWFTQTQMFAAFITTRLNGDYSPGIFEHQIMEYREEMEETTSPFGNMKAVGKKIVEFFRGSGDKIKKTFEKAVYI